ncbi:MAG: methylenetetrahydrofolate reductase [Nitrososphaerales archaeon]|nr:methylenetetrahydrofolate reductase [Nitrososphaerales archaeon]
MAKRSQNSFTSVVEVFPPVFSLSEAKEPVLGLRQKMRDFVERVRRIEDLTDAVLVADTKDPGRMKLSAVVSASVLKEETGMDAIPVITARDSNRPSVVSSLLTAYSLGLNGVMVVWGDRYAEGDGAKNVYNFSSLSELVATARSLANRAGVKCRILAPVDLTSLGTEKGLRLAKERLSSGADILLAQPPTTDSVSALPKHAKLLSRTGLAGRVFLNVFPFRDLQDIEACREKFGWELPQRLDSIAVGGESALLLEARRVAAAIQQKGFPGVYVTTRGKPEVARFILD